MPILRGKRYVVNKFSKEEAIVTHKYEDGNQDGWYQQLLLLGLEIRSIPADG